MTNKKAILLLSVIALVAATLRVLSVQFWQGLTFDEILSVSVASQPLSEIWTYLRWELHPPLHFIYLHFWLNFFGSSEVVIRLSSALLGVVSVYVMYLLGKEWLKSREAGIYAALLTSFSLINLVYSSVARMYSLLFLLGALSFYFFWKALKSYQLQVESYKMRRLWVVFYFITTLLVLYTHLTALVIPLIQLIYLFYLRFNDKIERRLFKTFNLNLITLILLYLPWLVLFIQARTDPVAGVPWFALSQPLQVFFISVPVQLIFGQPASVINFAASLVLLGFIFTALFRAEKINSGRWNLRTYFGEARFLLLLIIFVPMIALFALNLHTLRFHILAAIGVILILSAGLISIRSKLIKRLAVAVLLALLLIPTLNSLTLPDPAWPKVASFIETREQDRDVLIAAYSSDMLALNYYYHGLLSAQTLADPAVKKQVKDELELVMRTNSRIYVNGHTLAELTELIKDAKRVFLVFDTDTFGDTYRLYTDWFLDHSWRRIDYLNSSHKQSEHVWLFENQIINKVN